MLTRRLSIAMRDAHGQSVGWDLTRELHLNWMPLAQPPGEGACVVPVPPTPRDQSADEGTLIEVLIADDDDANLGNGTPHCAIILAAFLAQGIGTDVIACVESGFGGTRGCYADFDASTGAGVLDIFDFLAFQQSFLMSESVACDCDTSTGTGVCDVFDFICFQTAFAAGCERE